MKPIVLRNNITKQVIEESSLLPGSKSVVDGLINMGYTDTFAIEAGAVFEWLNTISLEDYEDVKKYIKLLK